MAFHNLRAKIPQGEQHQLIKIKSQVEIASTFQVFPQHLTKSLIYQEAAGLTSLTSGI